MKIVSLTTAAFLMVGAVSGYWYEAAKLRQVHAQGFALALTDFTFEIIYMAVFGAVGCLIGLLVGLVLNWLAGRPVAQIENH